MIIAVIKCFLCAGTHFVTPYFHVGDVEALESVEAEETFVADASDWVVGQGEGS